MSINPRAVARECGVHRGGLSGGMTVPAGGGDARRVEISPVRPDEYDAVAGIVLATYRTLGASIHPEYGAQLVDVAGRDADPNVVVLVARLDGRPVGHAAVVFGPSPMYDHTNPDDSSPRTVALLPEAPGPGMRRAR